MHAAWHTPPRGDLILGMGNPILGDDGVGLVIASRLEGRIPGARVTTSAMVGLALLDEVLGFERVFVIDAMTTRGGNPGQLHRIQPCRGPGTRHLFSSHGLDFFTLMDFARTSGYPVPAIGAVYGVEIGETVAFSGKLSRRLAARLNALVEDIAADIYAIIADIPWPSLP